MALVYRRIQSLSEKVLVDGSRRNSVFERGLVLMVGQAFEHPADRADPNAAGTRFRSPFVVPAQASIATQPRERPFHHPTFRQQHEPRHSLRSSHDLQLPRMQFRLPLQPTLQRMVVILLVGPHHLQSREPIPTAGWHCQTVVILHVLVCHWLCQCPVRTSYEIHRQPLRVHRAVRFARDEKVRSSSSPPAPTTPESPGSHSRRRPSVDHRGPDENTSTAYDPFPSGAGSSRASRERGLDS